jgi:hypothetical protein
MSNSNRSIQLAGLGAILAASVMLYLQRQRNRASQSKSNPSPKSSDDIGNDNELSYYQNLGISTASLPPHILRNIAKELRRKSKAEFLSMKSPMYDNVFMLDPDRNLMCTISLKKAKWYVRKGIAEWTSPIIAGDKLDDADKYIRLLFQPNGGKGTNCTSDKSDSERLYLQTPKQNICVSCGSNGHHMRHYIVPYSYRSLFPDEYKSHMSHDIVILCPDCHLNIDTATKRRMNQLEGELRDELNKSSTDGYDYWCSPVIEDTYLYHVRSCAIALVKWRENMPVEKVASHEREVREFLAGRQQNGIIDEDAPLTKAQLQSVCGVNYRIKNDEYIPGSELVVQSLNCDGDKIEAFIKEWRRHFINVVRPGFMPRGWSVDNPVICGRS